MSYEMHRERFESAFSEAMALELDLGMDLVIL